MSTIETESVNSVDVEPSPDYNSSDIDQRVEVAVSYEVPTTEAIRLRVTDGVNRYLHAALGVVAAGIALTPLLLLPGLIILVLPAEVYIIGRIYDDVTEARNTKNRSEVEKVQYDRSADDTEKARVAVYGTQVPA